MLNGLDLFSGIGGISLALKPWVRTVAYCEVDRYCQGVLLSRMQSGELSEAPIWDDVRTLKKVLLPEIDIIYGGFPCQDLSVAGAGAGLEGERSGLFFEIIRLTSEIRPRFVFLENVPAITVRGLDRVGAEFSALRYDCRWGVLSAAEMGAPHRRDRWFLLAHSNGNSGRNEWKNERSEDGKMDQWKAEPGDNSEKEPLANTTGKGLERRHQPEKLWTVFRQFGCEGAQRGIEGLPQPALCRDDDGLSFRVDRIKGLGNAVVPVQAREAFKRLSGIGDTQ